MSTIIDTLIYDRTQADVDRVFELKNKIMSNGLSALTDNEKTEYMGGMKGAYNYTDMNRVGQAVTYLANRTQTIAQELKDYRVQKGVSDDDYYRMPYGSTGVTVDAKTNWAVGDIPTREQATAYIQNLAVLRNAVPLATAAPNIPTSLDRLTFGVANDIEHLLVMIDQRLTELANERYDRIDRTSIAYTGLAYAGE